MPVRNGNWRYLEESSEMLAKEKDFCFFKKKVSFLVISLRIKIILSVFDREIEKFRLFD